ncbi:MAG: STAS domain-containing protein [Acidimicrobiales bacterium]
MTERHTLSLGGLRVTWELPEDGRAQVSLDGELDSLSVAVLRQALDKLYGTGCYDVDLEVTDLEFVDSSGLAALVSAWRRCEAQGGLLVVHHPSTTVRRLMVMTGISRLLLPGA